MRALLQRVKFSPLARMATLPMRAREALTPSFKACARALCYVIASREWADFRYDNEPIGIVAMAAALSAVTGVEARVLRGYAEELATDWIYRERHRDRLRNTRLRYICDPELRFGKSLLYYMLVRATKPSLVFEAGTDKGFGAFAICRALMHNADDGVQGHLVTIDIKTDRSDMLEGDENGLVTRLAGDSVAALAAFGRPIDFFLHDTTSESKHMRSQLDALTPHLAPGAIIYTSWFTQTFVDFSEQAAMACLEVADRPLNHWYRGARYGLAWRPGPHRGA